MVMGAGITVLSLTVLTYRGYIENTRKNKSLTVGLSTRDNV
jgi:hypothetical protein